MVTVFFEKMIKSLKQSLHNIIMTSKSCPYLVNTGSYRIARTGKISHCHSKLNTYQEAQQQSKNEVFETNNKQNSSAKSLFNSNQELKKPLSVCVCVKDIIKILTQPSSYLKANLEQSLNSLRAVYTQFYCRSLKYFVLFQNYETHDETSGTWRPWTDDKYLYPQSPAHHLPYGG